MALVDSFFEDFGVLGEEMTADAAGEVAEAEEAEVTEWSLERGVGHLARLRGSQALKDVMQKIKEFQMKAFNMKDFGTLETNPEYQLIVKSNDLIIEIDNEINIIHKYVKDIYCSRYAELATVVTDSIEYLRTVKVFGNNISDVAQHKNALSTFIASATIMVISITASSSTGTDLSETKLNNVMEACDMALELHSCKEYILKFVESRMPIFAPNLSAILGSNVAAKLIGHAGSLKNLAITPGCNIANYGSARKNDSGVTALQNTQRSCGFIFYSDKVQKLPMDIRKKAAKLYANKVVLAARIDLSHHYPNGEKGLDIVQVIQKTIDKWQEPPPVKAIKPLPAPIDMPSKKRGGRRHRKMKERLGITDLRRSANRMEFGGIDDSYENALTENPGRLGKTNRIRAALPDPKTRAKVSKSLNQKLNKQSQQQNAIWGGTTTVKKHLSGSMTTVAYTPMKGVEISNPVPMETKQETGMKYF